jgi:hypothetical protein
MCSTFKYFGLANIASLVGRFLSTEDVLKFTTLVLKCYPKLRVITCENQIELPYHATDDDISYLLNFPHIENLITNSNLLTRNGCAMMSSLVQLRFLWLRQSNLKWFNVANLQKLESLRLSNDINSLCSFLPSSLTSLHLEHCSIQADIFESIFNCNQLKLLRIDGVRIIKGNLNNTNLAYLYKLSQLENLALCNQNCLSSSILEGLTSLISLELSNLPLVDNLDSLFGLTSLTKMGLSNLDNLSSKGLIALPSLSNLVNLNILTCRKINDDVLPLIASLSKLICLRLNDTNITNITAITNLPNLVYFHLSNNLLFTDDSLRSLYNLSKLKILDLSGSSVSCGVMTHICKVKSLSLLSLNNCNIVFNSMLVTLKFLTNLVFLSLMGLDVDNNILEDISKLGNLTELHLDSDKYNNIGLKHICKLVKLRKLTISKNNSITTGGLRYITRLDLNYLDLSGCVLLDDNIFPILDKMANLEELKLNPDNYSKLYEYTRRHPNVKVVLVSAH